jgi:hypothetical protein
MKAELIGMNKVKLDDGVKYAVTLGAVVTLEELCDILKSENITLEFTDEPDQETPVSETGESKSE